MLRRNINILMEDKTPLPQLNNDDGFVVRPVQPSDIPAIEQYIDQMSDRDRYTRYLYSASVHSLKDKKRLHRIYCTTLNKPVGKYPEHIAYVACDNAGNIVGITHAWYDGVPASFEVSFSRRSDMRGKRIGELLMRELLKWADAAQYSLVAYTFHENIAMKQLFEKSGFVMTDKHVDGDYNVCQYSYR